MATTRAPAWGERDAVTGYYPQYRMSAARVIRALRDDTLQWIAVADPKAGRVDDFQIGSGQRVDGFQFKWKRYGGAFKFSDLTGETNSKPSLIEQLADGWLRLNALYPGQRIVVHLVTNQHPSTSVSQIPKADPPADPSHFAAFIEQVWKPVHAAARSDSYAIPPAWRPMWDEIQTASKLDEANFLPFVRDCDLEFGLVLPTLEGGDDRLAELYARDLEHLSAKLFEAVYDPKVVISLSRDELLTYLGWKDRFEYRNRHYFPVNEAVYQPIEASKAAIENALESLGGGYIGLFGSPGSGKSTLLTQTLRYFPARVIRYYAFVPDSQLAAIRGESVNFLHDIVRAIEDVGFRPGNVILPNERTFLRERLIDQLQMLHQDWETTGRKTIILVDGLDHIPREQHPSRSLLTDLPEPTQVPSGVYFVLGTQTDQLDDLPNSVQFAIRQPERRIEIDTLTRKAVREIIGRTDLRDVLTSAQMDRVFELSGGHPLALSYLLNELQRTSDRDSINEVLANASSYQGQIDEQYYAYWRFIDQDDELALLFSMVARLRGVIDLAWLESWADAPALRRLRRKFAHLFRVEDQDRWYFFHNSFRQFLRTRTAFNSQGVFDSRTDQSFHREIASKCRSAMDLRWQWEELYYLYQSGAYTDLLELATAEFFRTQYLNYRSLESIRADITLGIRACGVERNLVSLVRLMLLDAEMSQRQANTSRLSLASILLSLGEFDAASEHLRDGRRLVGSPETVLNTAPSFLTYGLENEARQLFDLAEPLDLLSGSKEIQRFDPRHEKQYLQLWSSSAIHFRSIEQITTAINRVRLEAEQVVADATNVREKAQTSEVDELRNALLVRVGLALLEEDRWNDLAKIEKAVLATRDSRAWWFVLRSRSWLKCLAEGELERGKSLLEETLNQLDQDALDESQRVIVAEAVFRTSEDRKFVEQLLQGVAPIGLQAIPDFNFRFSLFHHLFRYARLLYALGDARTPTELIPTPSDERKLGSAYFQRGICVIARIWALNWVSHPMDAATVRQEIFSLLRLFYHSWRDTKWDSWYSLGELKGDFYSLLISAVSLHGASAVQTMAEEFEKEWQSNRRYWSSDEIREVVLALKDAGVGTDWAEKWLDAVAEIINSLELGSRIEEKIHHVRAWISMGGLEKAYTLLTDALVDAASVGEKDYQLSEWIEWMQEENSRTPEFAPNRIAWFAEAVKSLDRNGGPAKETAAHLLEASAQWSPRRSLLLFDWFLGEGLVHFSDAIRRLVRSLVDSPSIDPLVAQAVLLSLLVPLCNDDGDAVASIVGCVFRERGRQETLTFAHEFKKAVEVRALGSRRSAWLRGLAIGLEQIGIAASEIGIIQRDLERSERGGSDDGLKLKDGTNLSLKDVNDRISTVHDLKTLIQAQVGSFYHWDAVVTNLAPRLTTSAEIVEVVGLFTSERFSASILTKLGHRLLELGEHTKARTVARLALSVSETSGWAGHLSGGTRIEAYKVLTAVDGQRARDEAFDELVKDMALTRFFEGSTYKYTGATVQYLRDILPLLTAHPPFDLLWPEVESHIHSLFPTIVVQDDGESLLNLLSQSTDSDTGSAAIIDLFSMYASHPAHLLSDCATSGFVRLLLEPELTAIEGIRKLLNGEEADQESALMIIDTVAQRDDGIVSAFGSELEKLNESRSMALRLVARRLTGKDGIRVDRHGSEQSLPAIYQLTFPSGSEAEDVWADNERTAFDFLPETEDPYQLLKIKLQEINWAASDAGLPEANVIQRAAQIFRQLAENDRWSRLGEKWLRSRLNSAGLEYPYKRPRSMVARRVFSPGCRICRLRFAPGFTDSCDEAGTGLL